MADTLSCEQAQELIEPSAAAGGVTDRRLQAHLDDCENCARSFELATRVERILSASLAADVPQHVVSRVMANVPRNERTAASLDRSLTGGLIAGTLSVAIGIVLLLNTGGLTSALSTNLPELGRVMGDLLAHTDTHREVYALATGLLLVTVCTWLWAGSEHEV